MVAVSWQDHVSLRVHLAAPGTLAIRNNLADVTGSGDIDVDLASETRSMSVETGSGNVLLRVPDTLGATIDVDTGSGGVETDLPMQVQRWSKDHFTGRLGDGSGRIDVETGSGRVKLVKRSQ